MGATGRGLSEHFGLDPGRVDVIAASLGTPARRRGGFCAGDTGVVAYQRLMGSGYVFSASLPPYLATAAAHAVRRISAEPRLVRSAQADAEVLRAAALAGDVPGLTTDADEGSPVVPLRLAVGAAAGDENALLADVARRARAEGVGVCVARVNPLVAAKHRPAPSLRVVASAARTAEKTKEALAIIAKAAKDALPAHALEARRESRGDRSFTEATIEPGRSVLGPTKKRRESSDVAPASPAKAPGVSVTLDGTIALNAELYPRGSYYGSPSIGIRRPLRKPRLGRPPARARGGGGPSGEPHVAEPVVVRRFGGGDERALVVSSSAGGLRGRRSRRLLLRLGRASRACGATATAPGALSVPLLVITLYLHNLFRRYILTQIDVTSRLVPSWLRRVGLHPEAHGRRGAARLGLRRADRWARARSTRRRFPRWFGPWTARSPGW